MPRIRSTARNVRSSLVRKSRDTLECSIGSANGGNNVRRRAAVAVPPEEGQMADSERSELDPPGIRYDIFADGAPRVGWYRFEAPPGTRAIRLPLKARRAAVWVDGKEVPLTGATATLPASRAEVSQVALRVEHEPGYYAGAAFENPVAFTCEDGVIALGDWGDHALDWRATRARWCTANGCRCRRLRSAAGRCSTWAGCAPPPRCGSTAPRRESGWPPLHRRRLRPAAHRGNCIEVTVHNTLANQYGIGYPTNFVYDGHTVSACSVRSPGASSAKSPCAWSRSAARTAEPHVVLPAVDPRAAQGAATTRCRSGASRSKSVRLNV